MRGKTTWVWNLVKIIVSIVLLAAGYMVVSRLISAQYLGVLGTKYESETAEFFNNTATLMIILLILYLIWFALIKFRTKIRIWMEKHACQAFIIAVIVGAIITWWFCYRTGMVSVGNSLIKLNQMAILCGAYCAYLIWCSPNNVCSVIYPGAQKVWTRVIWTVVAVICAAWLGGIIPV